MPLPADAQQMTQADVQRSIASEAFVALPTIHTRCELSARVKSDQTRTPKQSDVVDLSALCLAIPLCDLVLTDSFMAEKAKQRKFPKIFGSLVLPGHANGLEVAAAWLDALPAVMS